MEALSLTSSAETDRSPSLTQMRSVCWPWLPSSVRRQAGEDREYDHVAEPNDPLFATQATHPRKVSRGCVIRLPSGCCALLPRAWSRLTNRGCSVKVRVVYLLADASTASHSSNLQILSS